MTSSEVTEISMFISERTSQLIYVDLPSWLFFTISRFYIFVPGYILSIRVIRCVPIKPEPPNIK